MKPKKGGIDPWAGGSLDSELGPQTDGGGEFELYDVGETMLRLV